MRRLRYLRAGARALGVVVVLGGASFGVGGCGPARFLTQVDRRAANAVASAKAADAPVYAPYEYTAASEYLQKAREEGAYAEYQIAIEYGRRAEELADQAKSIAQRERALNPARPSGSPDKAAAPSGPPPAAVKDSP